MRSFAVVVAALAFLATFISPSASQTCPDRAITVVVPYPPGGNTDVIARIVLEGMSHSLGQRFVIENVGGAGGTTGSARAAPDGYTLLVGQMGTHAASVGLYGSKLPYHPLTDFEEEGPPLRTALPLSGRSPDEGLAEPKRHQTRRTSIEGVQLTKAAAVVRTCGDRQ